MRTVGESTQEIEMRQRRGKPARAGDARVAENLTTGSAAANQPRRGFRRLLAHLVDRRLRFPAAERCRVMAVPETGSDSLIGKQLASFRSRWAPAGGPLAACPCRRRLERIEIRPSPSRRFSPGVLSRNLRSELSCGCSPFGGGFRSRGRSRCFRGHRGFSPTSFRHADWFDRRGMYLHGCTRHGFDRRRFAFPRTSEVDKISTKSGGETRFPRRRVRRHPRAVPAVFRPRRPRRRRRRSASLFRFAVAVNRPPALPFFQRRIRRPRLFASLDDLRQRRC